MKTDYDRKTPYTYSEICVINNIKYKIIHTVSVGPAGSRIVSYEFIKIGEEIE